MVERRAELTPDAAMIVDDRGGELSFVGYRDAALRAAAGLVELGAGPGVSVSWQLPTWTSTLVLQAALARLGAVQNPIIPVYREREVGFCVRQTGARLFLVPSVWRGFDYQAMAEGIAAEVDGLDVVVCDGELPEGDPSVLDGLPAPGDAEEIRWVYYTSGTTSNPKGARHCDLSVMASGIAMVERQNVAAEDQFGLAFPFAHIGGVSNLSVALSSGCTLVIAEAFDPTETTALFARHGVTLVGGGAGVLHGVSGRAAQAARRADPAPAAALLRRRRADARVPALRGAGRDGWAGVRPRLGDDRGADHRPELP